MKSNQISVQMIYDDAGEPVRFLFQNGGGKFTFFDCAPSKAESVEEFLREALQTKPKEV